MTYEDHSQNYGWHQGIVVDHAEVYISEGGPLIPLTTSLLALLG